MGLPKVYQIMERNEALQATSSEIKKKKKKKIEKIEKIEKNGLSKMAATVKSHLL